MLKTHKFSSNINQKTSDMIEKHGQGTFYCNMSTLLLILEVDLLMILLYFYSNKVLEARFFFLVMEYFQSAVLILLLK